MLWPYDHYPLAPSCMPSPINNPFRSWPGNWEPSLHRWTWMQAFPVVPNATNEPWVSHPNGKAYLSLIKRMAVSWVRSWFSLLQAGAGTMGNAFPNLFDWYNLLKVVIETAVFFNWRSDCDDQQSPKNVLTYSMDYQSPWKFLQILDNTKILPLNTRLDTTLIINKYRVGFQGTQVL